MTETARLDITPGGIPALVHASQFDAGREIVLQLYQRAAKYTIKKNDVITVEGKKPDGTIFSYSTAYTVGGNSVTVTTTSQMCAAAGKNVMQLRIVNDDISVATANFTMAVERDPTQDGSGSVSDVESLDDLIEQAESYAKSAKNSASTANSAAGTAKSSAASAEKFAENAAESADAAEKTAASLVGIESIVYKGTDEDGGNIYTINLTDGTSYDITAPKGDEGNTDLATAATKLATARTIRTNLASTSSASFDGTANVTPGVTGILPVVHGGTGAATAAAARVALGLPNTRTITMTWSLDGYITSSSKRIDCVLPIGLDWNITAVTSPTLVLRTASGGYVTDFSYSDQNGAVNITFDATNYGEIHIKRSDESAFDATNNETMAIALTCTLTVARDVS